MGEETRPEVFILESLGLADEKKERQEGQFISHILKLLRKEPIYYYFRTESEFENLLEVFKESKYRYLHLSCHGDSTNFFTTFGKISFKEFGGIVRPHLGKKRLFLSACACTREPLAREVLQGSECLSLIGPSEDIAFDDAAVLWATFYHQVFNVDDSRMIIGVIKPILEMTAQLYDVEMAYFTKMENAKGYGQVKLDYKKRVRR